MAKIEESVQKIEERGKVKQLRQQGNTIIASAACPLVLEFLVVRWFAFTFVVVFLCSWAGVSRLVDGFTANLFIRQGANLYAS